MGAPPPIELANLGMADSLILMVLALVVFGPRRLPQIGRQIGKLMYEFRKASNDFKFQMEEELRVSEDTDRRKRDEALRVTAVATPDPTPALTLEAQADIGAADPSASTQLTSPSSASPYPASPYPASPYPGEGNYPAAYPPEGAVAEPEPVITIPRIQAPVIQPPMVGEQVSAAPPTAAAAPAHVGADAGASTPQPDGTGLESPRTEPLSQHG